MNKYRISKKNSDICWVYKIQRKFLFLWIDTFEQPYNQCDYDSHVEKIKEFIEREKDFAERKKQGNSAIIIT